MGDEAQIDDELYDRIYECMLQRLRDKFPIVRVHAVFALSRLQDPTDQDCPIINGKAALLCVGLHFTSGNFKSVKIMYVFVQQSKLFDTLYKFHVNSRYKV